MDGLIWDAQGFRQTHAFLALWGHENVGVLPIGEPPPAPTPPPRGE